MGNFLHPCGSATLPHLHTRERLLAPGAAWPGAFAGAGQLECSGQSDSPPPQLPGVGQRMWAHHLCWIPGKGRWAAAGMRGRALFLPGPTRSLACLIWFDRPGRLIPKNSSELLTECLSRTSILALGSTFRRGFLCGREGGARQAAALGAAGA